MIRFDVHVHPGSRANSVGGAHDGALRVHVKARAVDDAATKEVLLVLARAFKVRPSAVSCNRGAKSRQKSITVEGNDAELTELLGALLARD